MASFAMEIGNRDDYLQLSPLEEDDDGSEDIQLEFFDNALHHALSSYSLAEIIPRVGATGAQDGSELAAAVAEALKTVEAPSDESRGCPICLQAKDDDNTVAWKETPCGHRFHGWCVERWLQAKGSCPMCRRQVVTMPTAAATSTISHQDLEVISEEYGQDVAMGLLHAVVA